MPKISRFLYGNWLTTEYSEIKGKKMETNVWEGSYTVKGKYKHTRKVTLLDNGVEVLDSIKCTSNELMHIRWHSPIDLIERIHVVDGYKSPIEPKKILGQSSNYYFEKHEINVYQFSTSTSELLTSLKWE
jgi:hypothetical protein